MLQAATISILPSEGFFDRLGIVSKKQRTRFAVQVGTYGATEADHFSEGWVGKIIEGHADWLGLKIILRRKLVGYNDAVIAYIFDSSGDEIFSGTCKTKGLL